MIYFPIHSIGILHQLLVNHSFSRAHFNLDNLDPQKNPLNSFQTTFASISAHMNAS